jgi:hypothetical protein
MEIGDRSADYSQIHKIETNLATPGYSNELNSTSRVRTDVYFHLFYLIDAIKQIDNQRDDQSAMTTASIGQRNDLAFPSARESKSSPTLHQGELT